MHMEIEILLQYNLLKLNMPDTKLTLHTLPMHVLDLISRYLRIKDINRLAQTSKDLYEMLFVNVEVHLKNKLIEDKEFANILYWQFPVQNVKIINGNRHILKIIKFMFYTKDQGWTDLQTSKSWIEADFIKNDGISLVTELHKSKELDTRFPLVWNFETHYFQPKIYYLSDMSILRNVQKIQFFLRSSNPKHLISCQKAQVKLFYTHQSLGLNEVQLKQQIRGKRKHSIIHY